MAIYFIPPIFLFFLMFTFEKEKSVQHSFVFLYIFLISIIFGFRLNVDPDYRVYKELIEISNKMYFSEYLSDFFVEPFFYFSAIIFNEYLFFIFSLLSLLSLYYLCILNNKYPVLLFSLLNSCLLYICFFIQIRWGLAIVFLLMAMVFFFKKKYISTFFMLLFGMMNHISVVIFLSVLISKKYINNKLCILLSFVFILSFWFLNVRGLDLLGYFLSYSNMFNYIEFKIQSYQIAFKSRDLFYSIYYFKYILLLIYLRFISKSGVLKSNSIWMTPFILSILLLSLFTDVGVFAQRISNVCDFIYCLLFIDVISQFKNKKNIIKHVTFMFVINWVLALLPMIYKNYLLPYEQWVI